MSSESSGAIERLAEGVLQRVLASGIDGIGPFRSAEVIAARAIAKHGSTGGAIDEVIADLCSTRSTDRLICGDVGYGKTEVGMRGAMLAVAGGRQVADSSVAGRLRDPAAAWPRTGPHTCRTGSATAAG